jgi:hypothetical protein
VGWHEHDPDVFTGCERFFRPGYAANIVSSWIPALDGVVATLTAGASVADVGCGVDSVGRQGRRGRGSYGFSTLLCVPHAVSEHAVDALGSQAGERATRQVVTDAGFTRFRRAAQTPFNIVYEVRP